VSPDKFVEVDAEGGRCDAEMVSEIEGRCDGKCCVCLIRILFALVTWPCKRSVADLPIP